MDLPTHADAAGVSVLAEARVPDPEA